MLALASGLMWCTSSFQARRRLSEVMAALGGAAVPKVPMTEMPVLEVLNP